MTSELIGKTLGERYHFEHLIGSGTFAEVYRITDLHRRATLAAKVLRSDIARDSTLLERFQREARVLARLQHPNIVRYYDIVEIDNYRFILMDYIPGHTLDDELRENSAPIRPYKSLNYLMPLASALHFAHNEGIIHRDLKPANILLHDNGTLFVTDFGIARLLNVTSELTLGTTLGTPLYMAPEQITGDPVTVATDIYALGIILYRIYTGQAPFRGTSPDATGSSTASRITYEHVHNEPPPPTAINPQLDLAVQDIILRCIQKDPSRRYQSISELYDALAEAIGAPPIAIGPASDDADLPAADAPDRPDVKLPEWSQFMPPIVSPEPYATLADSVAVSTPSDDDSDLAETLAPQDTPDDNDNDEQSDHAIGIEHPFQAPATQPHLENALHDAERTLTHQSAPEPAQTLSSIERVVPRAHPTPRHLASPPPQPSTIAPPAQEYMHADPDYPPQRRNWFTILLVTGAALIAVSLCIAAIYVSGGFGSDSEPRDPAADITLSMRPGTLPGATDANGSAITPASSGNLIAFDSRRAGNLDIYIANTDGSNVRQITGSSGAERGPAWAPDGTQIAFYGAATENSNYDIYIINIDGTGLRNLTSSPNADDRYPTWSPDGTQIAFHSNANGDFDIYVINADGTGMTAVTNDDADDLGPDWSPDGTQIAYHTSQWDFPYELAILDLNTGQTRRLTDNDHTNTFPTWSPDGTQIVYNAISSVDASTNIFLINTDGTNLRQITDSQDRNAFPDWSPDGRRIIFQRGQPDVSAIYVMNSDGSHLTALTNRQSDFLPDWQP